MSRISAVLSLSALALSACIDQIYADGMKHFPSSSTSGTSSVSEGTGSSSDTEGTVSSMSDGESSSSSSSSSSTSGASNSDSAAMTSGTGSTGSTSGSASSSGTSGTSDNPPVCGNNIREGDEECDDGNDIDDDTCANCARNRRVFASAALHDTGDLNGIEGADSLCRQYALQSGEFDDTWKTFIAWLSDADHDVRDRLYPGKGRYLRMDGEVVVESVDGFYSGVLAAPINVDEHGQLAYGGAITGTRPDGTAVPGTHCENWTSGYWLDESAYEGVLSATDERWTMRDYPDVDPMYCSGLLTRLYCIEGE